MGRLYDDELPDVYQGDLCIHLSKSKGIVSMNQFHPPHTIEYLDSRLESFESKYSFSRLALIVSANQLLYQNLRSHMRSLHSYQDLKKVITYTSRYEQKIHRILTT